MRVLVGLSGVMLGVLVIVAGTSDGVTVAGADETSTAVLAGGAAVVGGAAAGSAQAT